MRLKHGELELEGKNIKEIEALLKLARKLMGESTRGKPNDDGETEVSPAIKPLKIPTANERLRRSHDELAEDKRREAEGLPLLTRAEIIKRRKEFNAQGGRMAAPEIDLDSVPE